jgi:hypothetical protein
MLKGVVSSFLIVLNKLPRHVSVSKCRPKKTKTAFNALEHLLDIFHLIKNALYNGKDSNATTGKVDKHLQKYQA